MYGVITGAAIQSVRERTGMELNVVVSDSSGGRNTISQRRNVVVSENNKGCNTANQRRNVVVSDNNRDCNTVRQTHRRNVVVWDH